MDEFPLVKTSRGSCVRFPNCEQQAARKSSIVSPPWLCLLGLAQISARALPRSALGAFVCCSSPIHLSSTDLRRGPPVKKLSERLKRPVPRPGIQAPRRPSIRNKAQTSTETSAENL